MRGRTVVPRSSLAPWLGGGSVTLFFDSFNREPDVGQLGTPDIGPAWQQESASWTVSADGTRAERAVGGTNESATGAGAANSRTRVTLAKWVNEAGVCVRYADVNNKIIWIPISATSMLLRKYVGGVQTNLAVVGSIPAMGDGTTLEVRASGGALTAYVNDILRASVTETDLAGNARSGLTRVNATGVPQWDDFGIYSL